MLELMNKTQEMIKNHKKYLINIYKNIKLVLIGNQELK